MNFSQVDVFQKQRVKIKNLLPEIGIEQLRAEILQGLSSKNKHISSKYFYDATGSKLFEEITRLPEYYPTRTEKSILREIAPALMKTHPSMEIIELGSGDCSKISILFDSVKEPTLDHLTYIPVDVSESAIEESADELSKVYPYLKINGYVMDFVNQIAEIPSTEKPRLICFFGSTIGNFSSAQRLQILGDLSKSLFRGDSLLIGFDLVKPIEVLDAAYNDATGITEKFNKNILNSVNEILQSDFNPDEFEHLSFFIPEKSRIEMHLVARKDCEINCPFSETPFFIRKGERIHTENSNKFTPSDIQKLAEQSDLKIADSYTDSKNWFALVRFEKK